MVTVANKREMLALPRSSEVAWSAIMRSIAQKK